MPSSHSLCPFRCLSLVSQNRGYNAIILSVPFRGICYFYQRCVRLIRTIGVQTIGADQDVDVSVLRLARATSTASFAWFMDRIEPQERWLLR